jgi:hypothetical protein
MNIEPTNEETIVSYIVKLNSATVTEVTEVPEVTDEIQVTPTSPSDAKHTETRPLDEEQERKLADDDVSLCCFVREALGDQGVSSPPFLYSIHLRTDCDNCHIFRGTGSSNISK